MDTPRAAPTRPDLVDRFLPDFDATIVREAVVNAPADATFAAIAETDLLDPVVRALFAVRELPARLLGRLRGNAALRPPRSVTICDLLRPGTGMTLLAWRPGSELAIGSVGRFWERGYGHREVAAHDFAEFDEPGWAKLVMALSVRPLDDGRCVLRYEARTATTDAEARRRFARYWRLIRPGVRLVMGRATALITREAERRPESPLSACSG